MSGSGGAWRQGREKEGHEVGCSTIFGEKSWASRGERWVREQAGSEVNGARADGVARSNRTCEGGRENKRGPGDSEKGLRRALGDAARQSLNGGTSDP